MSSCFSLERQCLNVVLFNPERYIWIGLGIEFSRVSMTRVNCSGNNGGCLAVADSSQRTKQGLTLTFEPLIQGLVQLVVRLASRNHNQCICFDGLLMFCVGVRHHHLAAIKDQQRVCCFNLNAAVVGFLLAALYDPVWTSAILSPSDFGLAIGAYTLLVFWKVPP